MTQGKRDPSKARSFACESARDPYAEGWDGQVAGDGRGDNPHPPGTVHYGLWDRGFVAAAKRAEQARENAGNGLVDLTGMGF